MDIRKLTDGYAVSPQIAPEDMARIKAEGFAAVICNRPDAEVDAGNEAAALRRAAEAEGLAFHDNPVVNGALDIGNVETQQGALDAADGPVLAYCRSGTRSATVWALGQAGRRPTDEIIAAAARGGYDLEGMRAQLDALATR